MGIKLLSLGNKLLYSDIDFVKVHLYGWYVNKAGYAVASKKVLGKWTLVYFHREIFNLSVGDKDIVDHLDGNKLNNQRDNLRLVSQSENMQNANKRVSGTSKYKGVAYNSRDSNWSAQFNHPVAGKVHLGYFDTELAATKACNTYVSIYFTKPLLNKIPS